MAISSFILTGLLVGLLSGIFGIGGGVVIVPMLMMVFGFTQKLAQGTSLAVFLITPSLLATIAYFQKGNVDFKAAALIWAGVFVGSLVGAYIVNNLVPQHMDIYLKRAFSVMMILIALKLWFS